MQKHQWTTCCRIHKGRSPKRYLRSRHCFADSCKLERGQRCDSAYQLDRTCLYATPILHYVCGVRMVQTVNLRNYSIARKFYGVKFSQKLIRLSFHDFIFADSGPIAIINNVNTVSWIKIFTGRDKSAKAATILPRETFQLYSMVFQLNLH